MGKRGERRGWISPLCLEYRAFYASVEQMKAEAGITEELKENDQMKWVGLINNVRCAAEEIVLKELVYT